MSREKFERCIRGILSPADVMINGDDPWDIRVRNTRFYQRVVREGSLGLGESYMDGWWDCDCLDEFFARVMPVGAEERIKKNWKLLLEIVEASVVNSGRKSRAFRVGERHYDTGNELFRRMLDKRMIYSCAYWRGAEDLDAAQEAKLDMICRKLALKPGDRILDIGCGWGGFGKFAAERYGAEVVGVTISKAQAEFGREICRGLPVEIRLQDYRNVTERFDHVVSVGMFEHVGRRNYRCYMEKVRSCLKDDGLFLLHTIGSDISLLTLDPWFRKYIFPNSHLPSLQQISDSAEGIFIIEDVHNIGCNYDATLMAWFRNFDSSWDLLQHLYDGRFYRMWKYYLLSCAGTFRSRCLQVWQFVFSKRGIPGGYDSICRSFDPADTA